MATSKLVLANMNLLLLHPHERDAHGHYTIEGRRFQHIIKQLKMGVGDSLRAGLLNGPLGRATIQHLDADGLTVDFSASHQPPAPTDIILLLALPRPQMLRRVLVDCTSLGIKHLVLLHSKKVEKSYWQTPQLYPKALQEKLLLGLEQAGDTRLPQVQMETRFKAFVEDRLPELADGRSKWLAHPGDYPPLPANQSQPAILALGPEGGWTDYECDCLLRQGFQCHSLGERILRVETAVPAALGRLLPC